MASNGQCYRYVRPWYWAVLLAVWAVLSAGLPVVAQAPPYLVGILSPGPIAAPAVEGLRQGLAQLGYTEGQNLAYIVEDAQGEVESLDNRAVKMVQAKPKVIFTIGNRPTAAAKHPTA